MTHCTARLSDVPEASVDLYLIPCRLKFPGGDGLGREEGCEWGPWPARRHWVVTPMSRKAIQNNTNIVHESWNHRFWHVIALLLDGYAIEQLLSVKWSKTSSLPSTVSLRKMTGFIDMSNDVWYYLDYEFCIRFNAWFNKIKSWLGHNQKLTNSMNRLAKISCEMF